MNEDWSGWSDLPWNELEECIEKLLVIELSDDCTEALTDIILQRMAVSLRKASRDQLLIEAKGLARLKRVSETVSQKGLFAVLDTAGRGLTLAATRPDESAIDSLLRSYQKYGIKMLEYIASNGVDAVVERKRIRAYLGIDPKNDSYLSHMLKAFEQSGLVLRVPSKDGTGVCVALDAEGKELVKSRLRPDWLPELVDLIESVGAFKSNKDIESRLIRTGLASPLASEIATAFYVARWAIDQRLYQAADLETIPETNQQSWKNSIRYVDSTTMPLTNYDTTSGQTKYYAMPAKRRSLQLRNTSLKEKLK